jgi:CRISPR/Cas system CSM-associated protein Csm3 (group 7 of RAMP superfamily)
MIRRAQILVHLEGSLLIGGYASTTGDFDATTAAAADGTPIVPASTLKGALREACTRLARVDGDDKACTIEQPCRGECLVCQLFGGPGSGAREVLAASEISAGRLGGLFLGDARPAADGGAVTTAALRRSLRRRPGVGIDRHTRSAVPQVFYEREVLDAPGQTFVAALRAEGVAPAAWDLFERAVRLVSGIGNSRSRGLGRVRLELGPAGPEVSGHAFPQRAPEHGGAVLELEALEPLLLGNLPSMSSLLEALPFIAGSALRGALGTAAARLGTGARFQEVFVEDRSCLLLSDAFAIPERGAPLPFPVPRSSLACKHEKRSDHDGKSARPRDGLLALALAPWLLETCGGSVDVPRCAVPGCGSPLRSARGFHPPAEPVRRVITRLARDLYTGSAMTEMLYTTTPFEPGTCFAGTVGRLTPRALEALHALAGEEIRIGRGRSRGQGLVKITVRDDPGALGPAAVKRRLDAYAKHAAEALSLLGRAAKLDDPGGAIAVLARTDVAGSPPGAPDAIRAALYGGDASRARLVAAAQAPGARSGWSDGHAGETAGQRELCPVVLAGSAWLFVHERGVAPDAERLARLETEGIGEHRELGLGRLAPGHELFID